MVDLDSACGATLTYRDLLECSNTWRRAADEGRLIDNVPRELSTFEALRTLAREVVDPVAARFGLPTITYGFAGPQLTKCISSQIAPHLDQHAGHERKGTGFVCARLGAAVDFRIDKTEARELARWIFENCAFDRIYIYGDARPIHVSVGPENARMVVELRHSAVSGRQVPYRLRW